MRRVLKVMLWIVGVVAGLLLLAFGVAAAVPLASDPPIDMANHGAGSSSVAPATSGLLRAFPAISAPADNETTPERAELGRLLFFDPVLSESDDIACATCHHPDLGFGDGRPTSVAPGGETPARNALTLWNVAYAQSLFWDGRVTSLEEQALVPLTHADEMLSLIHISEPTRPY